MRWLKFLNARAWITFSALPHSPYPTLKSIHFMLDMLAPQMPRAKYAKPQQFVDLSFLNEVEKEGFFTEVAKRYPAK